MAVYGLAQYGVDVYGNPLSPETAGVGGADIGHTDGLAQRARTWRPGVRARVSSRRGGSVTSGGYGRGRVG